MKQVIQNFKTGNLELYELPVPIARSGFMLIQNAYSLISAGTERSSVSTAQANLIEKARKRPDLVKQVLDNVKREGLLATYEKVKNRLDNVKALGYSSSGVVIESRCEDFQIGDRVACAGDGYASHAEFVSVPKNLVAKIPDNVDFDEAVFTTLGAIAMQGVRQSDVRVGENVAVIGLGLVGLLTVQILKASGCNVVGLDINNEIFDLAKELGCSATYQSNWDCLPNIEKLTSGIGADAVIITASAKSNEPMELAVNMTRKRGTIVVVGVVGMDIPRSPFYKKELNIKISCSYGPGRYDDIYEEKGIDYPVGYVRWTENRNMQAFLRLLSDKAINVKKMITHKFPIDKAIEAYDLILNGKEKSIGVLLEYPEKTRDLHTRVKIREIVTGPSDYLKIGFIGAGNFAQSYLIPNVKALVPPSNGRTDLKGVCTSHGVTSKKVAEKFGFEFCTTNPDDILNDDSINVVFVATRHNTHGKYVIDALKSGKHVFVEKPLCISLEELEQIKSAYESGKSVLSVGFNRRFSPYSERIKDFFADRSSPFAINYRINAGSISKDHWLNDPKQGGRIIGEACHFVDFLQFITDSNPVKVYSERLDDESCNITIKFEDGSIASINYLVNGDRSLPKERIEILCGGKTAVLDDWGMLWLYQSGKKKKIKLGMQKGHKEEVKAFLNAVRDGKNTIPFESIYMTTLTTLKVHESLNLGNCISF